MTGAYQSVPQRSPKSSDEVGAKGCHTITIIENDAMKAAKLKGL
jgi:hypothetical protein